MASGFWAGLGQGALIGAAGLVALSLLAPLPGADAPPDLTLDLPAGSEFGRAGDSAPVLPEPVPAAPRDRGGPAAVPAPASERAPAAMPGDTSRPLMPTGDAPGVSAQPMADPAPDLILPADGAPPAAASPAMPAPGADLGPPPDMTDLRRLERN